MESTLQNRALVAANASSKARTILYWIMTILVIVPIGSGGIAQMMQYFASPHGVVPILGYPMYFFAILGFWKFFGALTILVPRFPRLKEWAYAGIFFDLTGAAASCAMSGGYGAYGFHIIAPLIITGFMLASWALRPPSRTLGVISPAKNATA
jgi:heme/copper-type cytochrome/quinol oxidase subunit 1